MVGIEVVGDVVGESVGAVVGPVVGSVVGVKVLGIARQMLARARLFFGVPSELKTTWPRFDQ